jgi:myo-inositol 2-dehydrogenase/D-chiro-inositol 1-dehydrogenase
VESEGKPCDPWGKNCYNATPTFKVTYTYANGVKLIASSSGENGVMFEGDKGWIFVSRGRIGASDDSMINEPLPSNATRLYVSSDHHKNFVDGVKERKPCICTAQIGFSSVTVCHIGNISLRLGGRKLKWDPAKLHFVGDGEANAMLKREPRKTYV